MQKTKFIAILIIALVVLNIGLYFFTKKTSAPANAYTNAAGLGLQPSIAGAAANSDKTDASKDTKNDPPGQWTCTVRTGNQSTSQSYAYCLGNERVKDGGCSITVILPIGPPPPYGTYIAGSYPNANGWFCQSNASGVTFYAYAQCCQ